MEVKGGQKTTKTAAQLGLSVEDNAGTGGGGGSFVYTNTMLILAAGGGGGASGGYNGVDVVRRVQVAPVVWGEFHLKFGGEVLGGSQVNVTVEVLVTMGEWVQVGMLMGVPGQESNMENEVALLLKAGLAVEQAA